MPQYVICSPPKTATTSVGDAIIEMGLAVDRMPHDGMLLRSLQPALKSTMQLADQWPGGYADFEQHHGDEVRATFDAVTTEHHNHTNFPDAPFGHWHLHPFVALSLFSDTRLIWIDRPVGDWLASLEQWERSHPKTYPLHERWDTERDVIITHRLRRRYLAEGRFRRAELDMPDRCVRLHIDDLTTYDAIANELEVEAPEGVFPHVNRQGRVTDLVRLGRQALALGRRRN